MAEYSFGNYDYSKRDNRIGSSIALLAVGLGIGALAALMYAPKTGKQMRKMARRRYEDAREVIEDIGDRAGDLWDRREEYADAARKKVEPMARRFRRSY